jgi:N-formylmaleamate deformylase
VLVVDLQRGFTEESGPLGADLSGPVLATRRLLDVARTQAVTVIFTVIAYASVDEIGLWIQKLPGLAELQVGSPWVELDPRLGRRADERVIEKHGASALHDTDVESILRTLQADSVVLCGAATSGCVRASAVDLMQEGYTVLVPAECCGDRAQAPHVANLFDMSAKYADVVGLDEAMRYLREAAGSSHRS